MLIRQLLKEANGFDELIIGLNQRIFQLTSVGIEDGGNVRTKMIDNLKTLRAYSVCQELVLADFL